MSAVLQPAFALVPMTAEGLARIVAIERDCYEFPWTIGNFSDSLAAGYDCREYLCDGALVGYAVLMAAPDEVHLLNLTIARAFQRRGHGTALLMRLFDLARSRGARRILLEVRPSNTSGRALYARMGFAPIGERRGYYPAAHGREDALVLQYLL
jgi:ribosomal-protein-alanine acetyltransferase